MANYDWVKARDPVRPVQYEQAGYDQRNTDIGCPMYDRIRGIVNFATRNPDRPLILCEYAQTAEHSARPRANDFDSDDENGRHGRRVLTHARVSFDRGNLVGTWPYTMSDVKTTTHPHDLVERDFNTVFVDWKLHGVGGDNSGGARTHSEYTLPSDKPYVFWFTITPIR